MARRDSDRAVSDYTDFVAQLASALVINPTDSRYLTLLPTIVANAESRLIREPTIDFQAIDGPADISQMTTTGSRVVPFPPNVLVLESASLILPADQGDPESGERVPLLRTTRPFIDAIWPDARLTKTPKFGETYFCPLSQWSTDSPNQIIIAPTPDGEYIFEANGSHLPAPLSETNPTTFLTQHYYSIFFAASMVFACGEVLKNFGAAADDPRMAQSWEAEYKSLLAGVSVESMRQRSVGPGWTAGAPTPLAPTQRTDGSMPAGPPSNA
jgi:hypothetical protein